MSAKKKYSLNTQASPTSSAFPLETGTDPASAEMQSLAPVRTLTCCCCGELTRGRQWWNRDTGFGVCPPCVALVRSRGETETEIHSLYGTSGVHYGVAE